MKHALLKLSIASVLLSFTHYANATRWFEVEIIAFDQNQNEQLQEDFSLDHDEIKSRRQSNLLINGFNASGLKECLEGDKQFDNRSLSDQFVSSNSSWSCSETTAYLDKFNALPVTPFAEPQEHMDNMYLLAQEQLQLNKVIDQLKRRKLKPILHTGWRFPEMSARRSPAVQIIAGNKISNQVSYRIEQNINDNGYISLLNKPIEAKPVQAEFNWQVEGQIKIHVKHYLFVTTDLDIRFIDEKFEQQIARMSQFTRVYSGDIHYLDHPKLGIIFQIRKYKH